MVDGHCVRTIHAEVNAVAQAAKRGVPTDGCTAYLTHDPCWNCFKVLVAAGVDRIVSAKMYKDTEEVFKCCLKLGIQMHYHDSQS
jgi:dCMP deaminase